MLDYQMRTEVVARALARYRERHADEVRALADLERLLAGFPDDPDGNRALARALWGYDLWTRAGQLRGLVRLFRDAGVHDEETLRAWARTSSFERDFQGRVKGLGRTVYHSLVMRQGVDTVKPDVHVRRFAEAALGRSLADRDVVEVTTRAAARLGIAAAELDLRIWEASRGAPGY